MNVSVGSESFSLTHYIDDNGFSRVCECKELFLEDRNYNIEINGTVIVDSETINLNPIVESMTPVAGETYSYGVWERNFNWEISDYAGSRCDKIVFK